MGSKSEAIFQECCVGLAEKYPKAEMENDYRAKLILGLHFIFYKKFSISKFLVRTLVKSQCIPHNWTCVCKDIVFLKVFLVNFLLGTLLRIKMNTLLKHHYIQDGQKKTPRFVRQWEMFGQTKVTLKVDSQDTLESIQEKAKRLGLVACAIRDAGRTQIDPGTVTVVGVGPGPSELVDKVTGHLKLY